MVPSLHPVLVGPEDSSFQRRLDVLSAAVLCALTFGAYASGVFRVSGGVILLPGDATLVGLAAAAGIGYRHGGLAFAWLTAYAPLFGFSADWAFLGLPGRSLPGGLVFLLRPEGLLFDAAAAVVLGTLGFGAGYLVRSVVVSARGTADFGRESH